MPHPQRRSVTSLVWAISLVVSVGAARGDEIHSPEDEAAQSITASEMKAHIEYLADDERQGRKAGSPGGRAAAEYIVEQLKAYSIEPAVDGSYFQEFGNNMRNVIGILRGSDPEVRDEVVVVGAHYDHVGAGSGRMRGRRTGKGDDSIWNGADDNASGTSGVLEIAQAFSLLPQPPRRTMIFIWFDGEEAGLLGSTYYQKEPILPLDKTVTMVNLDMIGRGTGDRIELHGTTSGEGLLDLVEECNADIELSYQVHREMMANSDHYRFYQSKIPVLFFFTGLHGDYHRPSDHADKIEVEPMESIARLTFLILQRLASDEGRPKFTEVPRRQRLGVWGRFDTDAGGYRIQRLSRNGHAVRSGLKVGDVLLQLGDAEIKTGRSLRNALWKVKKDAVVPAHIVREGEKLTIQVHFGRVQRKRGWY
ncbi:MAG: M28 family peptidase [Planctomycetota bacterium]|nr:M28 family peptidase [Planctomycetota bacterium]